LIRAIEHFARPPEEMASTAVLDAMGKQLRIHDVVSYQCRLDGSTAYVVGHFRGVNEHNVSHVFFEPAFDSNLREFGTVDVRSCTKMMRKRSSTNSNGMRQCLI
jgi:hypothetical protein